MICFKKWLIAAAMLLALAGCSGIESYAPATPAEQQRVDLLHFFNGQSRAWGMVRDYTGKVVRRFTVDLVGCVRDGQLVLDEHFLYDDGETQFRQWVIDESSAGHYTGRAADISGTATGRSEGFALQWQYAMDLPVGDSQYHVRFDDWMYQLDNDHLFNQAAIKKWGITVARVTLFFQRAADQSVADCQDLSAAPDAGGVAPHSK
ncbi:DUF3833 domain-containing protein [Simiduia sp. 21SJ11W-1]|uniref:DUF3833 domain-containing protein n=1 Tax=Simiduia sp. 21SJ11W-1 TaxID=2909669 RepID=UPI0020A1A6FD|nr:DUF3833 domain-containing protein [Simiduia sp. 21SJ11W-1]UTA47015.1 DUF3833 domain-containing protein [Simiduia sp. 21SJ11W-1]